MTSIVCAIRGGSASIPTIDRAITLARETDLPLRFLYVVDMESISHIGSSRIHAVTKILRQMGDIVLQLAQARARDLGIMADRVIRCGNVKNEIRCLCQELKASFAVLGNPQGDHDKNAFTFESLRRFSQNNESEIGFKVILVNNQV